MTHPLMMITVLNWERRLEIKEEKRKRRSPEDGFSGNLGNARQRRKNSRSILARLLGSARPRRSTHPCMPAKSCVETR